MHRSHRRHLQASLSTAPGLHGVLPEVGHESAVPAAGAERPDPHFRQTTQFLEFAQAAGGFAVFDLNLETGGIRGTPLLFDLIGLSSRNLTLTREEWVATIHPED